MFPSPTDNGRPRNPSSVRKRLQLILERAGCKKVRFHDLRHTFATMALEHGMDVKTLSATIGHVSSATTLDIYSHITDTMQRQAAVHIDRKIGGTDAQMPTIAREERKDTSPVEFTPYKPKIWKPGTGCVTMINDHLYEGRYTPTNAYGKRESHNIYAKTREECEEKLAEMIVQVKAQIKAEKEKMTGWPKKSLCQNLRRCKQRKRDLKACKISEMLGPRGFLAKVITITALLKHK